MGLKSKKKKRKYLTIIFNDSKFTVIFIVKKMGIRD